MYLTLILVIDYMPNDEFFGNQQSKASHLLQVDMSQNQVSPNL